MEQGLQDSSRALPDPTRREILVHLSRGDMTIGEVTDKFDIVRAAVKKHLTILEEGQMISVHVQGRERINRLEPQGLCSVTQWLSFFDQFWDQRLGRLQSVVEEAERAKETNLTKATTLKGKE